MVVNDAIVLVRTMILTLVTGPARPITAAWVVQLGRQRYVMTTNQVNRAEPCHYPNHLETIHVSSEIFANFLRDLTYYFCSLQFVNIKPFYREGIHTIGCVCSS